MALEKRQGLVHVYTGDGKGKTTASMGLALRAVGHGFNVFVIQFLKGGGLSGELCASLGIDGLKIVQYGKDCPYSEKIKDGQMECGNCKDCFLTRKQEREKAAEAIDMAQKMSKDKKCDLLILDEINVALSRKLIPISKIKKIIIEKNPHTEIVLTGRNAPQDILDMADYATRMERIKHPFSRGMRARHGIDY